MKIALSHLKVDESLSPRKRLDPKHVDELVELAGEWPPVLVRPISHQWYTHQLVGGFHRTAAAEKLGYTEIEARVEVMDDDTALLRACQDNITHGQPLTTAEKQAWVVMLRGRGLTQERIGEGTGITQKQVAQYLAAERVEAEIIPEVYSGPAPKLTLAQSAALGKLVPSEDDRRRSTPTGPRLMEDPKREAARAQVPTIAKVAADKKLPPSTVSALADAALAEPELAAELVKRVETEPTLKPEAIRTAAKTIADPKTPQEVKRHNATPGALIQTQDGVSMTDLGRLQAEGEAKSPHTAALPFIGALKQLGEVFLFVKDEHTEAWLDIADAAAIESACRTLASIQEWAQRVEQVIAARKRAGFRIVSGGK